LGGQLSISENSNSTSTVTHFFQQNQPYKNKATHPNSTTHYIGYFLSNHLNLTTEDRDEQVLSLSISETSPSTPLSMRK
ncbi:hypothetical protein ACQP3J_33530, partial [Escherichia coli]